MVNDKIQKFFNILDNLTWLDTGSSNFFVVLTFIISAIATVILIPTLFATLLLNVTRLFNKKKTSSKSEEEDEVLQFLVKDKSDHLGRILAYLVNRPLSLTIVTLLVLSTAFGINSWKQHKTDITDELRELKEEIVPAVFEDYLTNYEGETIQPKEAISPSKIHTNNLYEVSFVLEGVHYNDQVIYVTYSDKFKSDTLIPFDSSNYPLLIPTSEQRKSDKGFDVLNTRETGFKLEAKVLNERWTSSAYIDDIDFVYNIRVVEKEEEEDK